MPQKKRAVIVVDHGSRQPEANALLSQIAANMFAAAQGAFLTVEPAHMEIATPSIADAFARCVALGANEVIVSLFFLSPGRHSQQDIPQLLTEAARPFPHVSWRITEPLGDAPQLIDLLLSRITRLLEQTIESS